MSTTEHDVLTAEELARTVQEKEKELAELRARLEEWRASYEATPKRDGLFTSVSGREVEPLYTPLDTACDDYLGDVGLPRAPSAHG